ncbi:unnamed protein product [Eruca vesicaria subsp. sativa]|uniref:Uncharacterized protein n=1 Tax=Eruca vesicaria subsp. sativa TaxID=29727 RepID=A0ABC8L2W4_ERUVS|nr:unnamed protein product [Eruca vesicaria subsp. sativa]
MARRRSTRGKDPVDGLTVMDVYKAENNPGLVVQPMMEITGERVERWGVFDEKYDKKVENMKRLLEEGYCFTKADWGAAAGKKNKRQLKDEDESDGEPVLKQRRMSEYYERLVIGDREKQAVIERRLEEVCEEVVKLKVVTEKQAKKIDKLKQIVASRSGMKRRKLKKRNVRKANDTVVHADGDGTAVLFPSVGEGEGGIQNQGDDVLNDVSMTGTKDSDEGLGREESTSLVKLVGGLIAEIGDVGEGNRIEVVEVDVGIEAINRVVTDDTQNESDGDVNGLQQQTSLPQCEETEKDVAEGGGKSGPGKTENKVEEAKQKVEGTLVNINELVGGGASDDVCKDNVEKVTSSEEKKAVLEIGEVVGGDECGVSDKRLEANVAEDEESGSGDELTEEEEVDNVKAPVMELSDSPILKSAKHQPVPEEEELAALLLARNQYNVSDTVPMIEDPDYPFFKKVLQANKKAIHLNAGGENLDNQFFLELATPQKWVSSTVW